MTTVTIATTHGDFQVELDTEKAPISCSNFLRYVDEGFYAGTVFHRVIPGFMIQGGGMGEDLERRRTHEAIKNEADNGLKNLRGTIAMARTAQVDSATTQFFVNLSDNAFLDHGGRDFGYAVFASVISGMDVVDTIAAVATGRSGMHDDVPLDAVFINKVSRDD